MSLKARLKALEKKITIEKQYKPIRVLMFNRCFVTADNPLCGTIVEDDSGQLNVYYHTDDMYMPYGGKEEPDEFDTLVDEYMLKQDPEYNYITMRVSKSAYPDSYTTTNM